jgi:class 3 adenylate cyclase
MPEQRKLVTAVFADIVGSVTLGERYDPEIVRGALNRYFVRTQEIAALYGGAVEKFIGDAVLVVFGTPQLHEDDAERAVRTALAIREFVEALEAEVHLDLAVRLGVNSGEAVVAEEAEQRYPITSDAINVAARLQQNAAPGEILVGALTERLTRSAIEYEPHEPVVAKGKSAPVSAFTVRAPRSSVPMQARGLQGFRAALVGRERELQRIAAAFTRAGDERTPQLLTVIGAAGVGKSRLVREALADLPAATRVLRGRCLSYGSGIAYWPLMDLVRNDAAISEVDDAGIARAKVHARIGQLDALGADADAVTARLLVLLGLDGATTALPSVPLERVGAEISWGLRRYIQAVTSTTRLVAVIDDVQWADEVVVAFVEAMLDQPPEANLLLLAMARPELFERHPQWGAGRPNAAFVRLEPLDPGQTEQLITALLAVDDLPAALRDQIVERSEGNPLFCEEFLRMLIDDGRIALVDDRWRVSGDIGDVRVPETIQALLGARVDGLPATERATLKAASVLGERFTVSQLHALTEGGATTDALLRRGLFLEDRRDPETAALRFKHRLIRDVAYGQLPKAERADLHDRFARQLEDTVGNRDAEFGDVVAHHAGRAYALAAELHGPPTVVHERAQRALRWLERAGDRALGIYATATALGYYTEALAIARADAADLSIVVRLFERRGRALELRAAFGDALENYVDLETLATERGDEATVALSLAHQVTLFVIPTANLDPQRGEQLLQKALRTARASGDRALEARLQWTGLDLFFWSGRLEQAWAAGEEAVTLARSLQLDELLALSLNDLARAYLWPSRRVEDGERALRESRDLFVAQGNTAMLTDNLTTHAVWLFWRGDLDGARGAVAELRQASEASGNLWGLSATNWLEQELALERGEIDRSIERGREAVRFGRDANNLMPRFNALASIWSAYHLIGCDDLADDELRSAADLSARLPSWGGHITGLRAQRAVAAGRVDEARALVDDAHRLERSGLRMPHYEALTDLAEVEVAFASGNCGEAATIAAAALARYSERDMRLWLPELEWSLGEARRRSGDHATAIAHFAQAADQAAQLGRNRILWQIHASRALAEDELGNVAAAQRARASGRAALSTIERSIADQQLVARFRAMPLVRSLSE